MKLLNKTESTLTFDITEDEGKLMRHALRHYPMAPTKRKLEDGKGTTADERAELLQEAMIEQRNELRQAVQHIVNNPTTWIHQNDQHRLVLTEAQAEHVLQILNDVRVGTWLELGEPDLSQPTPMDIEHDNFRKFLMIDITTHFQEAIVHGLLGEAPTGT